MSNTKFFTLLCRSYRSMLLGCLLFVCIALGSVYPASAQDNKTVADSSLFEISGQVCDSQGVAASDCSIALWRSADSTIIAACVSNKEGQFAFSKLLPDHYYLQIGGIIYARKKINVNLQNQNVILPPIVVEEQMETRLLSEVVLSSQRPRIKLESGTMTYAVSADPMAKSSSLYQILHRLPFVSISNSGVSIKEGLSPTFYINGIPAPHLNQNPKEALKSMRAEYVKEIQIITSPGVQYDGDISGGIINIVMKPRLTSSWTGSIGGNANSRHKYGGTSSAAIQIGNLIAQANVSYSNQNRYKEQWNLERIAPGSVQHYRFEQKKEREYYKNNYLLLSGNMSWTPNKNHLLNISFDYSELDTRGTGTQTHTMYNQQGDKTYRFLINEKSNTKYENLNLSANYQYKWGKHGLLSLMYQFASLPKIVDDTYLFEEQQNYNGQNQRIGQNINSKEHTVQGDYSTSFGEKHRLNGGIKSIIRDNNNETSLYTQGSDQMWSPLYNPDDSFAHRQNILGIYAQYQMKANPWDCKVGVRKEWTLENVIYAKQNSKNFNTRFGDWIISLFGSYRLSDSNSLSFYYRNNISRPSIYHLHPGASFQDPSYVFLGNPKLRSVKHHTFRGEWSYLDNPVFLSLSAKYQFSRNAIQSDFSMQPSGIMYRTFTNGAQYDEIGLSGYGSFSFSQNISASLNAGATYRSLKGKLNGVLTTNSGWTGSVSPSINVEFPDGYYLNVYGVYNFPYITLEGTGYNFYYCGGALSKSFFNDHLSLSLRATDFLWDSKQYSRMYHTPDFSSKISYQNYGFSLELGVVYRFNGKDVSAKETAKRIQNVDVMSFEE